MNRHFERHWGFHHLFIDARRWQREHESAFRLRDYEVLDLWDAQSVLQQIAREDKSFLHDLGRGALDDYASINPLSGGYEAGYVNGRLLNGLKRLLGHRHKHGEPPEFAKLYVCRRKRVVRAPPEPLSAPLDSVREAAERAPRGFVIVATVNEAGKPVPFVRLEILLADGQVLTRATGADGQMRLDPIPQGRCTVRLPDLDGSSWRPEAGAPSTPVDTGHVAAHVVKRGECLSRIARAHGMQDWKRVWNDPANEPLRNKRKNPNVLYPGDEVVIPKRKVHEIERTTDTTHRIVIVDGLELIVRVRSQGGTLFADAAWSLCERQDGAVLAKGKTDSEGVLRAVIPAATDTLWLLIEEPEMAWQLDIGELHPAQETGTGPVTLIVSGIQGRLQGLGFDCGELDGVAGPRTTEALAAFQAHILQREDPTGQPDDETLERLLNEYGAHA